MCSLLGLRVQSRRVSSTTTVKGMCLVVCHIKNNNFNKTFASTVHMWERLWFIGFLDQMLNFNRKLLPKLDQDSKSNVILVYFSVSVVFNRISRNFWANPPSFFFLMFNKFSVNFANFHDLILEYCLEHLTVYFIPRTYYWIHFMHLSFPTDIGITPVWHFFHLNLSINLSVNYIVCRL